MKVQKHQKSGQKIENEKKLNYYIQAQTQNKKNTKTGKHYLMYNGIAMITFQ